MEDLGGKIRKLSSVSWQENDRMSKREAESEYSSEQYAVYVVCSIQDGIEAPRENKRAGIKARHTDTGTPEIERAFTLVSRL